MQCCSTNSVQISSGFTDKEPIFDDLSVSKTLFTDKQAFSSDLSVNFGPLC
ncbi:prevent-host-death protein [Ligilactobacillus ruminis]|nr:prevent-host-death protein [Ligilactobacillus ruminis]